MAMLNQRKPITDLEVEDMVVNGDLTVNGQTTQVDDIVTTDVIVEDANGNTEFKIDGDASTPFFDVAGNEFQNVNNFKTKGGGSDTITFQDTSKSDQNILVLKEDDNITVPKRNLNMKGNVLDAVNTVRGPANKNIHVDIGGSGQKLHLRDSGNNFIASFSDSDNVSIPNGRLDVNNPDDTSKALNVGGIVSVESRLVLGSLDSTNEGAEITWRGAGSYDDMVSDRFQDQWRIFDKPSGNNVLQVYNDGTVKIPENKLDMVGNSIIDTNEIIGEGNVDHIKTAGTDNNTEWVFEKNNGSDIAAFKDSGNVTIPNGNLSLDGNNIANLGGKTDADTGALRIANAQKVAWRGASDNNDYTIRVDAGNDFVFGFGGTDVFRLNDNGLVFTASRQTFVHDRQDVSSDVTTDGSGYYSVDSSGGARTVTLSSSDAVDGKEINVKRNGANDVTVDTAGSQTIDDSSSFTLSGDNDSVTVIYNSTNSDWEIF